MKSIHPFTDIIGIYAYHQKCKSKVAKNRKINKLYKKDKKSIEIEILIRLYFIKSTISKLNKNNKNEFYLIDNQFIEDFKKCFDYRIIQDNIIKANYKEINDILINDICSRLSHDEKLVKKINENKRKIIPHIYKYFEKKLGKGNIFRFLNGFEMIDDKLYKLFKDNNYLKDNIEKVDVYKINDNKILIFTSKYGLIGYIDKNNIFIPEYYLDIKQSNIQNQKILDFCNINLPSFEKNNKYNIYKIDNNISCHKIIDDKYRQKKSINVNILHIKKYKYLNIDSYCCIDCNSEIEISKINICKDNEDDIIEYKCSGGCGIKSINLHKYLNKMILNTYLYRNCYICGNNNIDNIYFKGNYLNVFSYCFSCKKIFCNNYYCSLFHRLKCKNSKSIKINKMKNICLEHSNMLNEESPFTWYCDNEKKNLCDRCYSEENKNHNIIYKEQNAPIQIDDIKEEENIVLKIIEYLKEEYKRIINNLKNNLKKNKDDLNLESQNTKDNLNTQRKDELLSKKKELEDKKYNCLKNYNNFIIEEINHICDELKSKANKLKEENIIKNNKVNDDDLKNKLISIDNFFKNFNQIENDKKFSFSNKEKEYNEELESIQNEYNNNIEKINDKYNKLIEQKNLDYEDKIKKLEKKFETDLNNKIKYQIEFVEIILNTYQACKSNYYYKMNLYNLMIYFYNDKDIYEKVILKEINNSKNKDKLYQLISEKKDIFNFLNINNINNIRNSLNKNNLNCPPIILSNNIIISGDNNQLNHINNQSEQFTNDIFNKNENFLIQNSNNENNKNENNKQNNNYAQKNNYNENKNNQNENENNIESINNMAKIEKSKNNNNENQNENEKNKNQDENENSKCSNQNDNIGEKNILNVKNNIGEKNNNENENINDNNENKNIIEKNNNEDGNISESNNLNGNGNIGEKNIIENSNIDEKKNNNENDKTGEKNNNRDENDNFSNSDEYIIEYMVENYNKNDSNNVNYNNENNNDNSYITENENNNEKDNISDNENENYKNINKNNCSDENVSMNIPNININLQKDKEFNEKKILNANKVDNDKDITKQIRDSCNLSEEDYSNKKIENIFDTIYFNCNDSLQ